MLALTLFIAVVKLDRRLTKLEVKMNILFTKFLTRVEAHAFHDDEAQD